MPSAHGQGEISKVCLLQIRLTQANTIFGNANLPAKDSTLELKHRTAHKEGRVNTKIRRRQNPRKTRRSSLKKALGRGIQFFFQLFLFFLCSSWRFSFCQLCVIHSLRECAVPLHSFVERLAELQLAIMDHGATRTSIANKIHIV